MFTSTMPDLNSAFTRIQMGYGWHMRDGGYMAGGSWGAWPLVHIAFWVLLLAAILTLIVIIIRSLKNSQSGNGRQSAKSALDLLDERYARGEIDRQEYLQRKQDISDRNS